MHVTQVVPFFHVRDIERSRRFYESLGFAMTNQWTPDGKLRWCWLQLGGAALMLQQFATVPDERTGAGVSLNFICDDAVAFYRDLRDRGIEAKTPFVGNGMWVTGLSDPDGYALFFESETSEPEETVYEG